MTEPRAMLRAWTWCAAAMLALGGCEGGSESSPADGGGPGQGVEVGAADGGEEVDGGSEVAASDAAVPVGCDDGDPCTLDDSSPAPGCQPAVLNCDDGKDCTSDSCAQGKCVHAVVADCNACSSDGDCSDGDICTFDQCKDGSCAHPPITGCKACSLAADCDDGDACTFDKCQGTLCAHVALEGCKSCAADATCDDGDDCTTSSCQAGKCAYAAVPGCKACTVDWQCKDDDPCTVEFCIAKACTYSPATACLPCTQASDCSDGLACTVDTCQAGTCHFNPTYCAAGPYDQNPPQLPSTAGLPSLPVAAGMDPLPSCPAGAGAKGDGTVLAGGGLGCKTCCGPLANAVSWRCVFGACLVEQCKPGWHDDNGDGADGCETPWAGACDLYVAQTLTFAGADGSAEKPFPTLVQAAQAAKPGCRIHVGPGLFLGEVKLDGVRLLGAGPDKTVLARNWSEVQAASAGPKAPGIVDFKPVLAAASTSVEGVRVVGRLTELTGTASAPARTRWSAFGNVVWDIPGACAGLRVTSPHAVVAGVTVSKVIGKAFNCGMSAENEEYSIGVDLSWSASAVVTGLWVADIAGRGQNFEVPVYGPNVYCDLPGFGGSAVGLRGGYLGRLRNSRFAGLVAGAGKTINDWKTGELLFPGKNGRRIGLQASGPLEVDDVYVEGEPLYYAYKRDGFAVKGGSFDPTLHHTSQGHVYIAKSKGVVVTNLTPGPAAGTFWTDNRANGIYIDNCTDVTVANNHLAEVSAAVTVVGSTAVDIANNTFTSLVGSGVAVSGSVQVSVAGNQVDGAQGDGIRVDGSTAAVAANNLTGVKGIAIDFFKSQGKVSANQVGPGAKVGLQFTGCPGCPSVVSVKNTVGSGMKIVASPGFASNGDTVNGGFTTWVNKSDFDDTAYGVRIVQSAGAKLTDLAISGVYGFSGDKCSKSFRLEAGSGGHAYGLSIYSSADVVVGPARIVNIHGGAKASVPNCLYGYYGFYDGKARGIDAYNAEGLVLHNILVSDIAQPQKFYPMEPNAKPEPSLIAGQCLSINATATVDHFTCIATDHPLVTPIEVLTWSKYGAVSLRNSIVSGGGACIQGKIDASWSDFFACDLPAKVCPSGTCLSVDPLLDPKAPLPYSPICNAQQCSPALNAGDPTAPHCAEPAPNGCRADLGWTGNTPGASAKPGAAHCGCGP